MNQLFANAAYAAELEFEGFRATRQSHEHEFLDIGLEDIVLIDGDLCFVHNEYGEQENGDESITDAIGTSSQHLVNFTQRHASVRDFFKFT